MSSKVIRGDIESVIAPFAWRGTGGRTATAVAREAAQKPGGSPAEDEAAAVGEDIEALAHQSWEEGVREGRAAARKEYETQIQPLVQNLSEILESFAGLRGRIRRESEEELVELSIVIARRILHRELTLDPEAVRGLVKVALDRIGSRELNRVRVHPAHGAWLQPLLDKACPDRKVELVTDPALQPGDMVFETERGALDASMDAQLEEIRRGLADRLGAEHG